MFEAALTEDEQLGLLLQHHAADLYRHVEANRDWLERWLSWVPRVTDAETARAVVEQYLARLAANDGMLVGIWSDGALAGGVLLRTIKWETRNTEIGYWIGEDFAGRGLATRAAAAMLDFAFEELKLDHVLLQAATTNLPSRGVAERLGFTHEGTLRNAHRYPAGVLDHAVYGLTAEEWRKGAARQTYRPEWRIQKAPAPLQ